MSLERLEGGAQHLLWVSEELPEQQGKQFFASICSFREKYRQGKVSGEGWGGLEPSTQSTPSLASLELRPTTHRMQKAEQCSWGAGTWCKANHRCPLIQLHTPHLQLGTAVVSTAASLLGVSLSSSEKALYFQISLKWEWHKACITQTDYMHALCPRASEQLFPNHLPL